VAKKPVKKSSSKKKAAAKKSKEKVVGKAEHFFDKINVLTFTLKSPLKVGDIIRIKGHTTDFVQRVDSMQIEHVPVQKAKKGDGVGIKVKEFVRHTDVIYFADKKSAVAAVENTAKPAAYGINPISFQQRPQVKPSIQSSFSLRQPQTRPIDINKPPDKPKFMSF